MGCICNLYSEHDVVDREPNCPIHGIEAMPSAWFSDAADLASCREIFAADMTYQPHTKKLPAPNRWLPPKSVAFCVFGAIQEVRELRADVEQQKAEHTRAILRSTVKGYTAGENDDSKAWRQRAEEAEAGLAREQTIRLQLERDVEALRSEGARLKAALREFGKHGRDCQGWQTSGPDRGPMDEAKCTCGLRAVLSPGAGKDGNA